MTTREEIVAKLQDIKDEVRAVIEKHGTEASQLAPNQSDPHTPIISIMQMALAQAATEYLLVCGCPLPQAVQLTTDKTSEAMQQWLKTLFRQTPPQ